MENVVKAVNAEELMSVIKKYQGQGSVLKYKNPPANGVVDVQDAGNKFTVSCGDTFYEINKSEVIHFSESEEEDVFVLWVMDQRLSIHKGRTLSRGFQLLNPETGQMPTRETLYSAANDLYSTECVELAPGKRATIGTGTTMYMRQDEGADIRSKSGMAHNYGVIVLNSPGLIDCDYYGKEVKVILYNTGEDTFTIHPGDKIAQVTFGVVPRPDDEIVKDVSRNGGLGSTGRKGA